MSRSYGAGHPLTLRCGKCKVGIDHRDHHELQHRGTNLQATGRTKPLRPSDRGTPRSLDYRVEYRCLDCGYIGWSRHLNAERLLRRLKKEN